jgi:hypothetical protein
MLTVSGGTAGNRAVDALRGDDGTVPEPFAWLWDAAAIHVGEDNGKMSIMAELGRLAFADVGRCRVGRGDFSSIDRGASDEHPEP